MSKAVADPDEIRRFAQELKRFNNETGRQLSVLAARMNDLSQTWRDQEQKKFSEEFEQTVRVLARFVEVSNRHVPFLLRKAERIEDYLRQR